MKKHHLCGVNCIGKSSYAYDLSAMKIDKNQLITSNGVILSIVTIPDEDLPSGLFCSESIKDVKKISKKNDMIKFYHNGTFKAQVGNTTLALQEKDVKFPEIDRIIPDKEKSHYKILFGLPVLEKLVKILKDYEINKDNPIEFSFPKHPEDPVRVDVSNEESSLLVVLMPMSKERIK